MSKYLACVYICAPCVCSACGGQKLSDPLEHELQMAVSHRVGSWVLSKSKECSKPRSHLSSPINCLNWILPGGKRSLKWDYLLPWGSFWAAFWPQHSNPTHCLSHWGPVCLLTYFLYLLYLCSQPGSPLVLFSTERRSCVWALQPWSSEFEVVLWVHDTHTAKWL